MAFQHHFNSPVAGIFSKIFPRHGFLAPYARPTNFLKVGRPWFSLVDIRPTVFFEILLLEHQKWVFPRVSRALFRISFNQTDWKCCRGKRISRTGRGAAEREKERKREKERQSTLLCFMQLEREPVVTFFEARSRGGTGSKMSGEITRQSRLKCRHVKTDRSIEKSEQSEIDPNGRFKG